MKTIYPHSVERAIEKVDGAFPDNVQGLMNEFAEKQPHLLGYVMAASEAKIKDKVVKEEMMYMALIIWQAFILQVKLVLKVPSKIIQEIEAKNAQLLEEAEKASEEEMMGAAMKFMENITQPHLIEFISMNLNAEKSADDPFGFDDLMKKDKDDLGIAFSMLKMVIDCLNEVVNKPPLRIVR